MTRFVISRLLQGIALVFAVVLVNFALIKAAPGDPVSLFIRGGNFSPQYVNHIRHELGLDQPAYKQLITYIGSVARLDLGQSIQYQQPVDQLIIARLPPTLLLAGIGVLLSSVLGVLLGVASRRSGSGRDVLGTVLALGGYSIPAFWLGQLMILIFAQKLGWLPPGGMSSLRNPTQGLAHVADVSKHLVLPLVAYTVVPLGMVFLLMRARLREVLSMDFVSTARAKGMAERRVVYRHALPNAFLPVLTVIGYNFGFMLAGAVLVESVFGWPGIGTLLGSAVLARDFPLILGIFTITAFMVIVANTITDILYGLIDPRIRVTR